VQATNDLGFKKHERFTILPSTQEIKEEIQKVLKKSISINKDKIHPH
jgi:hypothetical protein